MKKILIIIVSMLIFIPYLSGKSTTVFGVKRYSEGITMKVNGQVRQVTYSTTLPEGSEITIPRYGQIELYSYSSNGKDQRKFIEYEAVFGPKTITVTRSSLSPSGTHLTKDQDNRSKGTYSRGPKGRWTQSFCLSGWDQERRMESCMRYYYACIRKNDYDTANSLLEYCGIQAND